MPRIGGKFHLEPSSQPIRNQYEAIIIKDIF